MTAWAQKEGNAEARSQLLATYNFLRKNDHLGFDEAIRELSKFHGKDPKIIVKKLIEAQEKK